MFSLDVSAWSIVLRTLVVYGALLAGLRLVEVFEGALRITTATIVSKLDARQLLIAPPSCSGPA